MMDSNNRYRLRVDNCIGTIIDVHKTVSEDFENEEFISRFEELQQSIDDLDMSAVCERDVAMVEKATNSLLGEFKTIFEAEDLGPIYAEQKS